MPNLSTTNQPTDAQQTEAFQTAWVYLTVQQFTAKHTAFNTGGVRAWIFHENTNGLAKSGAIVRIGRKVLIDEAKFFAWVESQNQGGVQ